MSRVRILMLAFAGAVSLPLGCCCVYSPERLETLVTGRPVPEDVLLHVEPGRTTRWWLYRFVGKPSRVEPRADGAELLTYDYAQTTEERLAVLGAELRRDQAVERARVLFELRDGVVQRVWRDRG